jgi:O-antigen biosynthesis protein WbqV
MTVHEAVQLILHSTAGTLQGDVDRGRVFVLDMGAPIKIVDLARRMIRAAGLEPDIDVKIDFVGLRPGEKLFEELFDQGEKRLPSSLPGIFEAEPDPIALPELKAIFDRLDQLARIGDADAVRALIASVVDLHVDEPEAAPVVAPAPRPVAWPEPVQPMPALLREASS